ncbi:MAG: molybdenum cofactor guanylyltransferase [Actinomycetota bacterium]|nr:molybdenum cofactor guanylyltransferase [Actinomycetota bacterium]
MMATAIILAGGLSKRMQVDKAFLRLGGKSILETQIEALRGLFPEIIIIGSEEKLERLSVYEERGVKIFCDIVKGAGPMGGILTGLTYSSAKENFVLACDMPFVNEGVIRFILRSLSGYQVAVPVTPWGLEPLYAAYDKGCVAQIRKTLEAKRHKVTDLYAHTSVNYIPWEDLKAIDPQGKFICNINYLDDLAKLSTMWCSSCEEKSGSFKGLFLLKMRRIRGKVGDRDRKGNQSG